MSGILTTACQRRNETGGTKKPLNDVMIMVLAFHQIQTQNKWTPQQTTNEYYLLERNS